ncbi:MAG: amidohydrolase family protein [Pirellulaceae bacterium]|nr:amidohydrolase family protein [Pirellulaceae bacterium]
MPTFFKASRPPLFHLFFLIPLFAGLLLSGSLQGQKQAAKVKATQTTAEKGTGTPTTESVTTNVPEKKSANSTDSTDMLVVGGYYFDTPTLTMKKNHGIVITSGTFGSISDRNAEEETLANFKKEYPNATVVELSEEDYILPGIFDLHAHYNVTLAGRTRQEETNVIPAVYLANGVTSTFTAGEYFPERIFLLKRDIIQGRRVGPRIFNTGPYYGSVRRGWNRNATKEEIYDEVDYWALRGVGGFKAKGIDPESLKALIERAHFHGLTVTGHLDSGRRGSVNPQDAIEMGIDRVEHFLGGDLLPASRSAYASLQNLDPDDPKLLEVIQKYIDNGVYFDATITTYGSETPKGEEFAYWTDERRFFTPYVQKWIAEKEEKERARPAPRGPTQFEKIYAVKQKTIKRFFDAGGQITLGTDHPSKGNFLAGFFAHREIETFVRAGIPEGEALKIATLNGAKALGISEKFGSIAPGKYADLFVVKGNPLQKISNTRNVHLVVKGGTLYETAKLLKEVEGKLGPVDEDDWR